ncbi:MAG TPA: type II secretion system F family protein [Solirubrobacterales bacterium]|nr:type II secretion system F family protein [Solirubrobacterales bacterium]
MSGLGGGPMLFGAIAGCLAVLALREVLGASGVLSEWLRVAIEPVRRARGEGYLPTSAERTRLAVLGGLAAVLAGAYLGGPAVAVPMAVTGPLVAGWLIRRARGRYRRAVERSLPDVARAIADGLSAGRSPRGALAAVSVSLEGPAAVEFERLGHSLELGHPTVDAIETLAGRFRSQRVDAFTAALVSQRTTGGDLAALLRRFADGAAERDQVAEDARSATAQARFTGYLVAAMPVGAALFTELIAPGLVGSVTASGPALIMVGLSVSLQAGGFVLISRLARVGAE